MRKTMLNSFENFQIPKKANKKKFVLILKIFKNFQKNQKEVKKKLYQKNLKL